MLRQWLRRDTHPDELCPWDESVPLQAAFQGQIEVLRWLKVNGWPCKLGPGDLSYAIPGPRHEVLDEEEPLGLPDDDYSWHLIDMLAEQALGAGRIDTVEFLMAQGVEHLVSDQSLEHAASTGQKATITWLLDQGAPLRENVACAAAGSGDVQFLKVRRGAARGSFVKLTHTEPSG